MDGFWSISVYNSSGYFEKERTERLHALNNLTAKKNPDGSIEVPVRWLSAGRRARIACLS